MRGHTAGRVWSGFWQVADPKIWIASTVPMAVGGALAYAHLGHFSWGWFLIGAAAIYRREIGKNAINEWVDYRSGVDRFVTPEHRTDFSGGKKTIVDGKLTLGENLAIGIATTAAGFFLGLWVALAREPSLLWIGLAGIFFALFYSLPPFQFAYRGLGELVVGITFGPLIACGAYLVQAHTVSIEVMLASLPLGFLIANVLWINQFPDYEADRQGGKRNWVVRLGRQRAVPVFGCLFALAFLSVALLASQSGNLYWLIALAGIPLAIRAVKVACREFDHIPRLVEANARTIQVYQITGLALLAGALIPALLK
jgi:1,4-dihydroxy-2-naphthoate polyprenyltransferase